jgi:hypothetical protein
LLISIFESSSTQESDPEMGSGSWTGYCVFDELLNIVVYAHGWDSDDEHEYALRGIESPRSDSDGHYHAPLALHDVRLDFSCLVGGDHSRHSFYQT